MLTVFKDSKGNPFTLPEICDLLDEDFEYQVRIGTDSQVHRKKRKVKYITAIVLYKKGKGGRSFIYEEWNSVPPRSKKGTPAALAFLQQRLSNEVWRSIQTCFNIQPHLPSNIKPSVDLDLNQDPKHRSNKYLKQLKGMVEAQGIVCRAKPDSWAAMCVADKYSK